MLHVKVAGTCVCNMLVCLFVMVCREQKVEENMKPTDQSPDFLSLEQHQLLSGKPSLKGLMDRLEETKQKTIFQVYFCKTN